jgi:flagellar protein FliL
MAENVESASNQKSKIMLWVMVFLALAVATDVTFRVLNYLKPAKAAAGAAADTGKAKEVESGGSRPKADSVKAVVALEPFLVNLADADSACYLKVTFQLGLAEKEEEKEGAGTGIKDPVLLAAVRDAVISLLSSKSSAQILTPEGKDKLREEIRTRLNSVVPKLNIHEVYIVDFVVSP